MTYTNFNPSVLLSALLFLFANASVHAEEAAVANGMASEPITKPAAATVTGTDSSKLYHEFCSVCHGVKGDGQSAARRGLIPPPRDFTSYQVAAELTRERMIRSISEGRQGTAMSGWNSRLSAEQISGLADFIRSEFMPAVITDDSDLGRTVYAKQCSVCHGDRGQGAVWARNGLTPPPADFTDPARTAKLTRDRMLFSVTYGRPQTAMSAWGKRFSEEEISAVVDYIRTSFMHVGPGDPPSAKAASTMGGHDHDAHGVKELNAPLPMGLVGDAEAGRELYAQNCSDCHGDAGDGKGPRAYFIFPKPRDFSHPAARAKYSRAHLFEVISTGVVGSEMPAWDKVLDEQQLGDLAEYVFTAFIRPAPAQ